MDENTNGAVPTNGTPVDGAAPVTEETTAPAAEEATPVVETPAAE